MVKAGAPRALDPGDRAELLPLVLQAAEVQEQQVTELIAAISSQIATRPPSSPGCPRPGRPGAAGRRRLPADQQEEAPVTDIAAQALGYQYVYVTWDEDPGATLELGKELAFRAAGQQRKPPTVACAQKSKARTSWPGSRS